MMLPLTPSDLFGMGFIADWQVFEDVDRAWRVHSGVPPVPELTRGQEVCMWLRIAERLEAERA